LGVISFVFVALVMSKERYKKKQVDEEIDKLKKEAMQIEKENNDLQAKLAYLESRDYQEKEAKDKLNLQSPDENVVVVKPNVAGEEDTREPEKDKNAEVLVRKSNLEKWWNYFFAYY